MKKWIFLSMATLTLVACSKPQFTIEGNVAGADGQYLYLESLASSSFGAIDSVRLDADGEFRFKHDAPHYPEFYQLRLGASTVHLVVDSIETLHFSSTGERFAEEYELSGSDVCEKMRMVSQESAKLKTSFNTFRQAAAASGEANREEVSASFEKDMAEYKEKMLQLVLEDPASMVAYYVVFQEINGLRVFSPEDPDDCKLIAAVATGFDLRYPGSARAKQLKEMALQGLAMDRIRRNPTELEAMETTLLDIELYDHLGRKQVLSQLAKSGKVILLDFTQYQAQEAPLYNMELGKLYEKYAKRGFEIYQISLDTDEHAWRSSANNLPWVCVRDPQGARSKYVAMYNVTMLPSCFVIDREGGIAQSIKNVADIEKAILAHL